MRNSGLALFLVALIVAVALFVLSVRRVSIPQRQLLCQLQPGDQDVSFVCPKGHHFNFVIGVPKTRVVSNVEISGKLLLKTGTNSLGDIVFDTQKSTQSNWLESENLDASVLTLPLQGPSKQLDQQLNGGLLINLRVEAKIPLENTASLWLTYLTRWTDLEKVAQEY